jgi:dynein intermediate chain
MADEARTQRAAALEEKKRRLEELKARRNRRDTEPAAAKPTSANLDEYIDGLLKTSAPPPPPPLQDEPDPPPAEAAAAQPQVSVTETTPKEQTGDNVIAVAKAKTAPAPPPVIQVERFTIATQTQDDDFPPGSEQEDEEDTPEVNGKQPEILDAQDGKELKEELTPEPKILTEEEMEEQVSTAPFSSFLNNASKKVERMLGTTVLADLLVNYVGETDGMETTERPSDGSRYVSAREVYQCAKWTATRDVTDMDWSPLHRELMLSSYHMPSSSSSSSSTLTTQHGSAALSAVSPDDTPSASLAPRSGELQSDGLALVWSLAMPSRPEHIFTCGSPVLAARFHPTDAPLIIGGCQSGQLVVWDVRAGRLPVQRSSMTTMVSSKGHVHPICSMEIVEGGVSELSSLSCSCWVQVLITSLSVFFPNRTSLACLLPQQTAR